MRKKLLFTLLTAPCAFGALANINVDSFKPLDWTVSGLVGDQYKTDTENDQVTAAVGSGILTQELKEMPKGKYHFSFREQINCSFSISVNGEEISTNDDFTLEEDSDITITVTAEDPSKMFRFVGATLEIVFDWEEAKTSCQNDLDQAVGNLLSLRAGDESETAKELQERIDSINKVKEEIQDDINKLGQTEAQTLDTYKELNLADYPDNDKIHIAISDLAAEIEILNPEIEKENNAYDIFLKNQEIKSSLNKDADNLTASLEKVHTAAVESINNVEESEYSGNIKFYALGECNALNAAITDSINVYRKEIEAAFADLSKPDISVDFKSKSDSISASISNYEKAYPVFIADATAYYKIQSFKTKLEEQFKTTSEALDSLKGIENYEDLFRSNIEEWQEEASSVYRSACDTFDTVITITGAADFFEKCENTYTEANDTLVNLAANKATIDAQNELMLSIIGKINEIQTDIDNLRSLSLDCVDDVVDEQQAFLDSIKAKVEEDYRNLELEEGAYDDSLDAISTAINSAKVDVQPILDLQTSFEEKKKEVNEVIKDTKLAGKFDGTFESIQEGINALTIPVDLSAKEQIEQAIDNTLALANRLVEIYNTVDASIKKYGEELDSLNKVIDNKWIAPGSAYIGDFKDTNKDYQKVVETIKGFNRQLGNLKDAQSQECYDILTTLDDSLKEYEANGPSINSVLKQFEAEATDANFAVLKAMMTEVLDESFINDVKGEYYGQEAFINKVGDCAIEVLNLENEINAAKEKNPIIVGFNEFVDEFNKFDQQIDSLISEFDKFSVEVKRLKENQEIANGFVDTCNGIVTALEAAAETNTEVSWEDAKTYYANYIGTADDEASAAGSLYAQLAQLKKEIQESLEKGDIQDKETEFNKEAERLKDIADKLPKAIKENHDAFIAAAQDAASTNATIESVIKELDRMIDKSGIESSDSIIADWRSQLDSMMVDLQAINDSVATAYGRGVCYSNQQKFKDDYNELRARANALIEDICDKFANVVGKANKEWSDKWLVDYAVLRDAYKNSVAEINRYMSLTNVEYRKAILNAVGDNEALYQYANLITTLNAKVIKDIEDMTAADKVVTAADYETIIANSYISEMDSIVKSAQNKAYSEAQTYYGVLIAQKTATIEAAENKMAEAGIEEAYYGTEEDRTTLTSAEESYNEAVANVGENGSTDILVKKVDDIANKLEHVQSYDESFFNSRAKEQWKATYSDDKETLDGLAAEVETYRDYVDPSNENFAKFEEAKSGVESLPGENITIQNLREKLDALNGYMADAREAESALQEAYESKKADQAAGEALNAEVSDLYAKLDALREFGNDLAGNVPSSVTDSIESEIEDIKGTISDSTDLKGDEESIRAQINEANAAIDSAYTDIVEEENKLLEKIIHDIHVAYNNVVANGKFENDEVATEQNEEIDKLAGEIKALYEANREKVGDDYKLTAQKLEQKVTDKLVELQALLGDVTDLTGVLTALDELYTAISADITESKEALDEEIVGEYAPKYEKLQAELDAVKEEYESLDAKVMLYQQEYVSRMNDIESKLDELDKEAAKAAQEANEAAEAAAASKIRYDYLSDKINSANTALEELAATIENYGVAGFDVEIAGEKDALDVISQEVDAEFNGDGISEEEKTTFDGKIESVLNDIAATALKAAETFGENSETTFNNAYSEALSELAGNHVVNGPELLKALNGYSVDAETAKNELNEALTAADATNESKIAAYEKYAATLDKLRADVEEVKSTITENTYVLGDINEAPDGEVNVVDLQILINWVGKRYTYDDVAEMYGEGVAAAGDINGDQVTDHSKEYNISDVTGLIYLIIDPENSNVGPRYIVTRNNVAGSASVSLAPMGETEDGVRRYAVLLSNSTDLCSGQFDFKLPVDCELVDVSLSNRAADHSLSVFDENGTARVLVWSMTNSNFESSEGEIIYIDVRGKGTPEIEAAMFSDNKLHGIQATNAGMAFIDRVIENAREVKETIYNAAGQTMRYVQRGFNIIRRSDGSVEKKIQK